MSNTTGNGGGAMSRHLAFLRLSVFALCLTLFVLHSSREIGKYFTNLTSTSIRTDEEEGLGFPVLVFCHKLPFKTAG